MVRGVAVLGVLALSLVGSGSVAYAYDQRVDPNAANRAEISFAPSQDILRALDAAHGRRPAADKNTPRQ